jgi:hypothetical protein
MVLRLSTLKKKQAHHTIITSAGSSSGTSAAVPLWEPSCFSKAIKIPEWRQTMAAEINVLIHHGKWESVPRPPAANVVGNKCVYKLKRQADGSSAKLA